MIIIKIKWPDKKDNRQHDCQLSSQFLNCHCFDPFPTLKENLPHDRKRWICICNASQVSTAFWRSLVFHCVKDSHGIKPMSLTIHTDAKWDLRGGWSCCLDHAKYPGERFLIYCYASMQSLNTCSNQANMKEALWNIMRHRWAGFNEYLLWLWTFSTYHCQPVPVFSLEISTRSYLQQTFWRDWSNWWRCLSEIQ